MNYKNIIGKYSIFPTLDDFHLLQYMIKADTKIVCIETTYTDKNLKTIVKRLEDLEFWCDRKQVFIVLPDAIQMNSMQKELGVIAALFGVSIRSASDGLFWLALHDTWSLLDRTNPVPVTKKNN